MAKLRKADLKTVIVAAFLVVIVLIYFFYLSNRSAKNRSESVKSEIEKLSEYDMNFDYPKTPRDLAKLHSRFFKVFYGEKKKKSDQISDEQLAKLNTKVRQLYCSKLLTINPEMTSLDRLKKDIEKTKAGGYAFNMSELPEASQVKYFKADGNEMAKLEIKCTLKTEDGKGYLYLDYLLIKENGRWKIYGWEPSNVGQSNSDETGG
ncbi:MAG: hypothetical protein IKO61_06810 [Lachnospiraceae bacterium]|nr:hypothetical protein [Lachnospiraceae bacterium]